MQKIKTYEYSIRGYPTITKTGRSRGKLLARCFYDYQSGVDYQCTFKEFLKICSVVRVRNHHMNKIWIGPEMKEAIQVGPQNGNQIPFMYDYHEFPVSSHELDVSFEGPLLNVRKDKS